MSQPNHTTSFIHRARTRCSGGAAIAAWLVVVAVGWWCVESYQFSVLPAAAQGVPEQWPMDSALVRSSTRPTLVLFLHPKCPCSQATVNELSRLLAEPIAPDNLAPELIVVTTVPSGVDEAWWDTKTVAQSTKIARSNLFIDRDGREAARFGASTSGFVLLFDEAGGRRFAGGITTSRGHEGRSAGADDLSAILSGQPTANMQLPVFGCRLCLPEAAMSERMLGQTRLTTATREPAL